MKLKADFSEFNKLYSSLKKMEKQLEKVNEIVKDAGTDMQKKAKEGATYDTGELKARNTQ